MNSRNNQTERDSKLSLLGIEIPITRLQAIFLVAIAIVVFIWWNWPEISSRIDQDNSSGDALKECQSEDPNQVYECLITKLLDSLPPDQIVIYPLAGNTCTSNPKLTDNEKMLHQRIDIGGRNCELQATTSAGGNSRKDGTLYLDKLISSKSCNQGRPSIKLTGTNAILNNQNKSTFLGTFTVTFTDESLRDTSLNLFRIAKDLCSAS